MVAVLVIAACNGAPAAAPPHASAPTPATPPTPPTPVPASEPTPAAATPEPTPAGPEVVLVPLRTFPPDLLDAVEAALVEEYDANVRRTSPRPLPDAAYYRPRKRYRAEKLLTFLATAVPDANAHTRVLGLTEVDISTTNGKYPDWGIFGYGEMPGRAAVLSSFRLERKARDRDHVKFRVATTAVHEIGHTLGLDHCPEPRCVMQDARGSIATTDRSTGHLGPGCRAKLGAD